MEYEDDGSVRWAALSADAVLDRLRAEHVRADERSRIAAALLAEASEARTSPEHDAEDDWYAANLDILATGLRDGTWPPKDGG